MKGDPARRNGKASTSTLATSEPMPAWMLAAIDGLDAAGGAYAPEQAREVVAVMEHFHEVLAAAGRFATRVGETSADAVALPASAREMFLELGSIQARSVEPVREGLAAAKRTVLDRIHRYEEGGEMEARWDVDRNKRR